VVANHQDREHLAEMRTKRGQPKPLPSLPAATAFAEPALLEQTSSRISWRLQLWVIFDRGEALPQAIADAGGKRRNVPVIAILDGSRPLAHDPD
jgi:hypothetical protein